ncbi:hypothetical protein CRUP_008274 [Coryphaenoides rupestris]|nr:hypothetical protein CRUP_008274 [Coryphaenoides rupestris]
MACRRRESFLWGKAASTALVPTVKFIGVYKGDHVDNSSQRQNAEPEHIRTELHGIDASKQRRNTLRNRIFLCGKKKFNMDPKKGVCYLVENNLLEWTAVSVAEFIYKEEGLNKTAIGNFLGERQFLWSFRLPGEAQKIDRMMEAFAGRYCNCNAGVFQSTGTAGLHIFGEKGKLYESIYNEPFKIPEDDGNDLTLTFFNPDREGWLLKRGGRVKTWKRRWFILTDNCLYYFQYTTEQEGWITSIRSSISKDPFYDLVSSRKRRLINSSSSTNNNTTNDTTTNNNNVHPPPTGLSTMTNS